MRVVWRGRSVNRVATGVRGHGHHGHSICKAAVDGLQRLVVEGLGEQDSGEGFDELRVGDRAVGFFVCGNAGPCVFGLFAAQVQDEVRNGEAKGCVLFGIACLQSFERAVPVFSRLPALPTRRSALAWKTGRM